MGGNKFSANPWLVDHYPGAYLSMGLTAERVASHYGITREEADAFALASPPEGARRHAAGSFDERDCARSGHELHHGSETGKPTPPNPSSR